jgi:hypothetical protein
LYSLLCQLQRSCATVLQPFFVANGLVAKCLEFGQTLEHVMDFTRLRALGLVLSLCESFYAAFLFLGLRRRTPGGGLRVTLRRAYW